MHASLIAELGSWVAVHANNLIYGHQNQPMLASTSYWMSSTTRVQRWIASLKLFEEDFNDPNVRHDPWPALEIVVQEILLSELLTRIWSAVVTMHDTHRGSDELHGLAHSVFIRHQEVKNRALRILIKGQAANEAAFDRMNRLRRRLERWTDLFLSQLPHTNESAMFAFDSSRVTDFSQENRTQLPEDFAMRQKVLAASFTTDLIRETSTSSANPDLNREIVAGILACFPADRFDSCGIPKSLRAIWLEKSGNDTSMLVDNLMSYEQMTS